MSDAYHEFVLYKAINVNLFLLWLETNLNAKSYQAIPSFSRNTIEVSVSAGDLFPLFVLNLKERVFNPRYDIDKKRKPRLKPISQKELFD